MAFRFSRRVSILPGLKLNLSGGGVSLSAGVRGAHINVGPRGVFVSASIPGAGISYRQRVSGGGDVHRVSPPRSFSGWQAALRPIDRENATEEAARQIEELGRIDRRNTAAEAVRQIEEEWEAYQRGLNFWRPLPEIPTLEDFVQAQTPRSYEPAPPPLAPSWAGEQAVCLERLTESVKSQWEYRVLPEFLAAIEAKKLFKVAWPNEEALIQASYERAVAEHESRMEEARAAWASSETDRVAWLKRLTSGNLAEVGNTLTQILTGLSLPFQEATQCSLFFNAPEMISFNLELPGIETVTAPTRKRLLENGTVKEWARSRLDRNKDYFYWVTGVCAFVAAEVFSYLPLCQSIRLAAHTRTAKLREADPLDTYILDLTFSRELLREFDPEKALMETFLIDSGSRFDLAVNYNLKRIKPPSWLTTEDLKAVSVDQIPNAGAS